MRRKPMFYWAFLIFPLFYTGLYWSIGQKQGVLEAIGLLGRVFYYIEDIEAARSDSRTAAEPTPRCASFGNPQLLGFFRD